MTEWRTDRALEKARYQKNTPVKLRVVFLRGESVGDRPGGEGGLTLPAACLNTFLTQHLFKAGLWIRSELTRAVYIYTLSQLWSMCIERRKFHFLVDFKFCSDRTLVRIFFFLIRIQIIHFFSETGSLTLVHRESSPNILRLTYGFSLRT